MRRLLKNNEYKILEALVSATQEKLFKNMVHFLQQNYEQVTVADDYVYAIGDIPIALVAHLDTVHRTPVRDLYYDQSKGVLWSPEGIGADDRAGVFAILNIIKSGLKPSVIFTKDEEQGGLGASSLSEKPCPFPGLKYIIELDRRGWTDCVFYDCGTEDFIKYIESFGFKKSWGSFSDISFLAPAWDICAVNLSIGYYDEHSISEILCIEPLFETIEKVKTMLKQTDIPTFFYEDEIRSYLPHNRCGFGGWWEDYPSDFNPTRILTCSQCGDKSYEYEMIPVKGLDGTTKFYCPDCYSNNQKIDWCSICYEAYEVGDDNITKICKDCLGELLNDTDY